MTQNSSGGLELLPWPQVDYAAFGPVETQPLPRFTQFAGGILARNWVMIPHVTHHDDLDITALEDLRKRRSAETKLTLLPFLIKAIVSVLKAFPQFNASLDGKNLIIKKYFHIGVAVDTPLGLLVPVLRDADKKTISELAAEIAAVTAQARSKGLQSTQMSGGSFSISSLGSIGGTGFTPIINAPEVAILGVSRAQPRPVSVEERLEWRTMLPVSLSYDHRVINGADAARFCVALGAALKDSQGLAEL
jgi:pyruvate dehydrogenase E2 component (dihydrolipoamide acetyltransferase)